MYIHFEKIEYKNFLSSGNNSISIDLDTHPKTLIHGRNGSGKTTFVEAIYFALFGKSFRKANKQTLINYVNKKKTLVTLWFSIRNDKFKIKRGLKPAVFEIYKNNKLIDEAGDARDYQKYLETFILHMGEKLFKQTVLLGSSNYIPFMLLTAADRRIVVENLLDIQIFSVMNELAKAKFSDLSRLDTNLSHEINLIDVSLKHKQSHFEDIKNNSEKLIQEYETDISNLKKKTEQKEKKIVDITASINDIKTERDKTDLKELKDKQKSLSYYHQFMLTKTADKQKQLDFYNHNDVCPVCSQDIDKDHKNVVISSLVVDIDKFETGVQKADEMLAEILDAIKTISSCNDDIMGLEAEISLINSEIGSHQKEIETIINKVAGIRNHSSETKLKTEIHEIEEKKTALQEKHVGIKGKITNYETVLKLLKDDGIKTRIIKTYIPIINKLIKKYLDILNFPITFRFDESFNEYIVVRGREDIGYSNLSEGEKMRVNLALIFAFRELSSLRNATHCNILIFDEIADSSLDFSGWEAFLQILKDTSKKQNVFVISHKGDSIISKFDCDIKFIKPSGRFSEIVDKAI